METVTMKITKLHQTLPAGLCLLLMLLTGCGSDSLSAPVSIPAPSWTVDESQVPVVYPPAFTPKAFEVNQMYYSYYSTITYDQTASSFEEKGEFDITEYRTGFVPKGFEGYALGSGLNPGYYALIGDFSITGKVTADGAVIENGVIHFYIDLTPKNCARNKDILVGSSSTLYSGGAGSSSNPNALGSYDAVYTDFKLTDQGTMYWKAPQSFYTHLDFYGNVLTSIRTGENPNVFETTGAGGAYFVKELSGK
jgi:hypothetical protein